MNCVSIFLKKEIKEIMCSKRLVISLLFGAIFCVFMNVVANMPGATPMFKFEIGRGLISVNLLIMALCTDVVYITMVEEVVYGTFDLICLSKCNVCKTILLKCCIPIVFSIILFLIGIVLNNFCAFFSPKLLSLSINDGWIFVFAILTAVGCNIAEFSRCCGTKTSIPPSNNVFPFFIGGIYALLYYWMKIFGYMMLVVAVLISILIYVNAFNKLKKNNQQVKKTRNLVKRTISDGSYLKSIASKEVKRIIGFKLDIFRIIYYHIMLILSFVFTLDKEYKYIIIYIFIYICTIGFSADIYFNSVKLEIYEKMDDILFLAGIEKRKNYKIMMLVTLLFGLIIGCITLSMICLLWLLGLIKFINISYWCVYFLMLILNMFISYVLSYKFFLSIKVSKIIKRCLYIIIACLYIFVICVKELLL